MAEMWRLFVAIPVPDRVRADLRAALREWSSRKDLDGLRWVDPDAWHVTLAFLGATRADTVPDLCAALRSVASAHEPVTLPIGGIGGFPSSGRARVAWYGVSDVDGRLGVLAAAVREAAGTDPRTPFRPHLTLARARRDPVDLRPWIAETTPPARRLHANDFHLMRSHVGGGPARYESLASVHLGEVAHV